MKHAGVVCGFAVLVQAAAALPVSAGLTLEPVATGLNRVTTITHAGDGTGRLFFTLQQGLIMVRDSTGVLPTPFLDIRSLVSYSGEMGLLGLAFPKNYASSRRFYVHYVDNDEKVVVARYFVGGDPNVADPVGQILLTVPQPYENHKGGQLQFGPDGYLYVGLGDGGSAGDPQNNGQNLGTLLGKILRIDVSGNGSYTVPVTNPFWSTPGARPEIWAYGLRNPWRFSFDRATGDVFIGDVGQYAREEIDFQPAGLGGRNYGWRRMEGSSCYNAAAGCDTTGLTLPILEYSHDSGCSVTGGYRYQGTAVPGLVGTYLFGDFCEGTIWAGRAGGVGWTQARVVGSGYSISTFGEDEAGEIYVADYRSAGAVYKVVAGPPALALGDVRLTEGDSGTRDAVFTVLLLPASPTWVTFSYRTVQGTAIAGNDFTATTGTLTLPPGTSAVTIAVPVQGDTTYEQDETFSLVLSNPANASIVAGAGTGVATIVNDDSGISIADVGLSEGNSGTKEMVFTVSRIGVRSSAASVDYATSDGTALAGVDYVASTGTVSFAPDQSSATFVVPVLGDILVEALETFTLTLSNVVGGSIVDGTAVASIFNDDTGPEIAVNDVNVAEGDAGTTNQAVFTVSLSYASEQTVTVRFQTFPNSASGTGYLVPDYQDTNVTLSFAPGVTSQGVSVTVLGDLLNEADEGFSARLSEAVSGKVTRQGWGTILDNDPMPAVSVGPAVLEEGDAGKRGANFPVTLSAPSGRFTFVRYVTTPGTAAEGPDPISFGAGQIALWSTGQAQVYPWSTTVPSFSGSVRKVSVKLAFSGCQPALGQSLIEFFDVLLVGPQGQSVVLMSDVPGSLLQPQTVLTFDDDGPALPPGPIPSGTYRPTDYDDPAEVEVYESPAPSRPYGTTLASFQGLSPVGTWSLFVMGDRPTPLGWGCSAHWGLDLHTDDDYVRSVSAASFSPGVTEVVISVPVLGDQTLEGDETFSVELYQPSFVTIDSGHAVGTIVNDDQLNLRVGDLTVVESDTGSTDAVFTVTLDQPGTDTVTVEYATVDGSASAADGDFVATSGTLSFAPGETIATIAVSVVGDVWHEADESFSLVLSAPAGAEIVRGTGVVLLPNDDPTPKLAVADVLALEGETAAFRVSLSAPSREPVTVGFSTANGTATGGADYTATAGVLTFPPLSTHETISVPLLADAPAEPSESFSMTLDSPSYAEILDGGAVGWIFDPQTIPRLQFSSSQFKAPEGARSAVITVRRSGDNKQTVSVDYRASDGSAQSGSDYTPVSGTLTLPPGVAMKTFSVPLLNDAVVDGPKTVLLDLSEIEGPALMGAPQTAVLTIADDDVGGKIRFGKPLFSVNEAGGQATITVQRSGGAAGGVTVQYSMSDDGATAGIDYQPAEGTLLFGPRAMSQTFTVPVLVDTQAEGQERVTLSLADPTGGASLGTPAVATLAIGDAQPTVEFAAPTFAAKEGAARATVTVLRSGPLTGSATVSYATSDGTALQGVDYVPAAGVLTFGPGAASRTFGVDLLNNSLDQAGPTILLSLSGPAGAVLGGQATAVLQVQDNDAAGVVQFGAAGYQASDTSSAAIVAVSRSGGLAQDVQVDYATTDGTAQAGVDYTSASGTLTFGAGVTRQTFSVPLLDDGLPKGDETVLLSLANPTGGSSLGARSTALLTITTSDPTVQFSAAAYRAAPGAASATIVVTRSGPVTTGATVDYATSDGSALGGEDYAATTGTLTFDPGVKVRTFTVPILGNVALEGDETVNLTLASPGGGVAVGKRGTAVLTIPTDDAVVQWALVQVKAGERARSVALVAKRLGSLTTEVTVQYATSDGSAESGTDYVSSGGTVTFRPGVASQTVRIPIVDDAPDEGDETFQVTLGSPGPGVLLGASSVATVTILDNDLAGTIELATSDWSVRADGGLATITVTRSGGAAGDVTVDYATGGGTAAPGVDYEAASGTLVFGPGDKAKTFSIAILAAPSAVGNTSVGLTLSNPGGGAALGAKVAGQLWIVKP